MESTAGMSTDMSAGASRIRRQRGYAWEDTLVKRFNNTPGWRAFRLGSPSIRLPDVLAVNTAKKTMLVIEAKSGTTTSLPVPGEQIIRCMEWMNIFEIYRKRGVVLAFKFLSKKRVGLGRYEGRELREFYKVWDMSRDVTSCTCNYDGRTFAGTGSSREEITMKDYRMPFAVR